MRRALIIAVITLALLEVALRLTGLYSTFSEKNFGYYETPYGKALPTWFHTWSANKPVVYDQPEIKYSYPANSLGLREKEPVREKPDSVIRILFLGDSFTEGDGAVYDSSMPRFLEKILVAKYGNVEVFNAGVNGSDPFYSYTFYRDKLLGYDFDKVILCINNSDIDEVGVRGDASRFQADGTTRFRSAPWYAPFYHYSHVVRMVIQVAFHRNENFMKITAEPEYFQPIVQQIASAVEDINSLSRQRNTDFLCVIHPFPFSFEKGYEQWKHILLIEDELDKDSIPYIDLYLPFQKALKGKNHLDYGWPINRHFNARGYELYAQLLYTEVEKEYPGFWVKPVQSASSPTPRP